MKSSAVVSGATYKRKLNVKITKNYSCTFNKIFMKATFLPKKYRNSIDDFTKYIFSKCSKNAFFDFSEFVMLKLLRKTCVAENCLKILIVLMRLNS